MAVLPPHDYAAAGFLTTNAVMFVQALAESNREANYAMGFVLSFVCLGLTAAESNVADACMRDHGAGVEREHALRQRWDPSARARLQRFLVISGEIFEAFAAARYPRGVRLLFVRSGCSTRARGCTTLLMKHFGAVAAAAKTTAATGAITVMLACAVPERSR